MARINPLSIALAALLSLLVFANTVHPLDLSGVFSPAKALTMCGAVGGTEYAHIIEWVGLSLAAIMAAFSFAVLGQVLGGTFGGQKYNEFVKGMFWGAIETAALLGLFTALFSVLWPYGMERLDTARAYAVLAKNTVFFDFGLMLGANFIMGFVTNMNPQFKIPGPAYMTVGFQVAPMFKPILDLLGVTMQLITTAVVMWSAQEFLICFIKTSMLTILLPAGFFMRGLGLKAGGNALIGLAISLFFIYPHMIIMLGEAATMQIQNDIVANDLGTGQEHMWLSCTTRPICCLSDATAGVDESPVIINGNSGQRLSVAQIAAGGAFRMDFDGESDGSNICMYNTALANMYHAFIKGSILGKIDIWSVSGGAAAVGTAALLKYMNISWMTTLLLVPLASFTIYAIIDMVYFVFVMTMILPLFIIFTTLTLAKEIAKVLGTEIDLSSLEKLI